MSNPSAPVFESRHWPHYPSEEGRGSVAEWQEVPSMPKPSTSDPCQPWWQGLAV